MTRALATACFKRLAGRICLDTSSTGGYLTGIPPPVSDGPDARVHQRKAAARLPGTTPQLPYRAYRLAQLFYPHPTPQRSPKRHVPQCPLVPLVDCNGGKQGCGVRGGAAAAPGAPSGILGPSSEAHIQYGTVDPCFLQVHRKRSRSLMQPGPLTGTPCEEACKGCAPLAPARSFFLRRRVMGVSDTYF